MGLQHRDLRESCSLYRSPGGPHKKIQVLFLFQVSMGRRDALVCNTVMSRRARELEVEKNEQVGPVKPGAKTNGKDSAHKTHVCNDSKWGV